jgi:hypothetical protein
MRKSTAQVYSKLFLTIYKWTCTMVSPSDLELLLILILILMLPPRHFDSSSLSLRFSHWLAVKGMDSPPPYLTRTHCQHMNFKNYQIWCTILLLHPPKIELWTEMGGPFLVFFFFFLNWNIDFSYNFGVSEENTLLSEEPRSIFEGGVLS